jgi:hypothetical protein
VKPLGILPTGAFSIGSLNASSRRRSIELVFSNNPLLAIGGGPYAILKNPTGVRQAAYDRIGTARARLRDKTWGKMYIFTNQKLVLLCHLSPSAGVHTFTNDRRSLLSGGASSPERSCHSHSQYPNRSDGDPGDKEAVLDRGCALFAADKPNQRRNHVDFLREAGNVAAPVVVHRWLLRG